MKILAIESAALVASAAILQEDVILGEISLNTKLTHSQTLLPMIDSLFNQTGVAKEEIDAIAVSAGPGSFTGLRIGAATAKGLGMAWQKPLVAVPTLDALAYGLWGSRFLVCPIMDARRSQVYTALYRFDDEGQMIRLEEPAAMAMEEQLTRLAARGQKVVFTGDGLPVFQEMIEEKLGDLALTAPAGCSRQRAGALGTLGLEMFRRGETVSPTAMGPSYLRLSQAERERAQRLGTSL